mmetsp:Transcript_15323/g.22607  ORF Transcript_15323/g.22607 Transcript_15323/m.22607 type:complete len:288 (-) Transcript_15323:5-868(-)
MSSSNLPALTAVTFGKPLKPQTPILVFLSGFPDDHRVWCHQIEAFKDSHHMVCIAAPHFDQQGASSKSPMPKSHPTGYTMDETVDMIVACIKRALPNKDQKFDLVTHDWGAYWGYFVASSKLGKRINKMIAFDIGIGFGRTFWLLPYQLGFAFLFWIGITFGPDLADSLFRFFIRVTLIDVGPLGHGFKLETMSPRPVDEIRWWMGWPYYQMWKAILGGKQPTDATFPSMPLLFINGKKKRVDFHSELFLKKINDTKGCKQIGYDCYHWIMWELPTESIKEMKEFLD